MPHRNMRQQDNMLTLVLIMLFFFTASGTAAAGLRIGDSVPLTTLSSITGNAVKIPESLAGKVAIIHFWQAGCSSCRLDMPAMDVLYTKYRRKGLEILAVNVGQPKESVKSFAADLKVSYPILIDPDGRKTALYDVKDVPRTYIIDRRGIVRYRIFGGASEDVLKRLILSLF